jgi:hypothetical protein
VCSVTNEKQRKIRKLDALGPPPSLLQLIIFIEKKHARPHLRAAWDKNNNPFFTQNCNDCDLLCTRRQRLLSLHFCTKPVILVVVLRKTNLTGLAVLYYNDDRSGHPVLQHADGRCTFRMKTDQSQET